MIDIHSHILPFIDDGPDSWTGSMEIAHELYRQGIKKVIATPHIMQGIYQSSREEIEKLCDQLNTNISRSSFELEVLPGAEIFIDELTDFDKDFHLNHRLAESKYLLIEFSLSRHPGGWENFRFKVEIAGYSLIIAHPERYPGIDIKWLEKVALQGSYLQINCGSLLGSYGKKVQLIAQEAVSRNIAQFIASDVHNTENRKPYFNEIKTLMTDELFLKMTSENPSAILNGNKLSGYNPLLIDPDENKNRFIRLKRFFTS